MRRAWLFDPVHDAQRVFRALLEAFANPGRVVRIDREAARLPGPHAAWLALACAFVDSSTGYCVLGSEELSDQIQQFTFARREQPGDSGFLFVLENCDAQRIGELLRQAPCGTLEQPHLSATIVVGVRDFEHGRVGLTGPGIDGRIDAPLDERARRWLDERVRHAAEYPCGVDLVFLSDEGALMAAPRLVRPAE